MVLPLVLFGAVAWIDHRRVVADTEAMVDRTLITLREHALKVFDANRVVLDRLDERMAGVALGDLGDSVELHEELRSLGAGLPQALGVWIVNADGMVVNSGLRFPLDRPPDVGNREYVVAHRDRGERMVVSVDRDFAHAGEPVIILSRRLDDGRGGFRGVIAVGTRASYFADFHRRVLPGPLSFAALVGDDGRVLARQPPFAGNPETIPPGSGFFRRSQSGMDRAVVNHLSPIDGVERVTGFRKLPGLPVHVGFGVALDDALAPWRDRLWLYGALCGGAALVLSLTALLALSRARREERAVEAWKDEARRRADAEATLVQSQKLQALGRLTGGVAHEYNNLLTAVTVNLHLAGTHVGSGGRRFLDDAALAAERAAKLTRELLSFSRQDAVTVEAVSLNDALRGMSVLIERSLRSDTRLALELDPADPVVEVDPVQLEFAVLNLILNARDAMRGPGGSVAIRTMVERSGMDGARVLLEVGDNGHGMPEEVRQRAFEPFFTTKDVGAGAGLGLSMVYGFASHSGGSAEIESAPGEGTRVRVSLPLSSARPAESGEARSAAIVGHARVLVVEDNALVLMATQAVLQEQGFDVVTAEDGEEALAVLARDARIAAVVSDIVMPRGVSGLDLWREVRRRWPHVRVLLTSGYSRDVLAGMGADMDIQLLPKPFSPEDLRGRLLALFRDRRRGEAKEFPGARVRHA